MRAGIRKGNKHLRGALIEASLGAVRKRDSYIKAKYYKLTAAGRKHLDASRKRYDRVSMAVASVLEGA